MLTKSKKSKIIIAKRKPILTIAAAKKAAASNIEWYNILSELIDNGILIDKNRCVNFTVNLVYDSDNDKSYIEVIDDSIGIPESDVLKIFDYGVSSNDGKMLLCKMGMGLKGAVWGLGEFEYLITKTEYGTKNQIQPVVYDSDKCILEYEQVEPNTSQLDAQKSGTIVRIKRVKDTLPKWTNKKHFDKFVDNLNSMYASLLSENKIKITVSYKNESGSRWTEICLGSFPLMSNPRHILNSDINIGFNEPTYMKNTSIPIRDIIIKTKNTKVKLTAFHKPTPNQVEKYYDKYNDPAYNPLKYKDSLFTYGSGTAGITIMYKGKYIEFGVAQHLSRTENQGIIVEIDDESGLSFTGYKNTLKKNNNYHEMIDAVMDYLKNHGFFIRAIVGVPNVAESEIVQKFLDRVKDDTFYQDSLDIVDYDKQVQTWVRTEVGETDVIIKDYKNQNKVITVIEAKKDSCSGIDAAQLWGYMAYHNCKRGILLSGMKEQPSFTAMINALKEFTNLSDAELKSLDIKTLVSSKFFSI
jgi:hypothetical protein